jgi:hypothetical protein
VSLMGVPHANSVLLSILVASIAVFLRRRRTKGWTLGNRSITRRFASGFAECGFGMTKPAPFWKEATE